MGKTLSNFMMGLSSPLLKSGSMKNPITIFKQLPFSFICISARWAVEDMERMGRYNKILFMADTCQAISLGSYFSSPNAMLIGSSLVDESAYSYEADMDLGVSLFDRYTYAVIQYLQSLQPGLLDGFLPFTSFPTSYQPIPNLSHQISSISIYDILQVASFSYLRSHPSIVLHNHTHLLQHHHKEDKKEVEKVIRKELFSNFILPSQTKTTTKTTKKQKIK